MRTRFYLPLVAFLLAAGCHGPLETKEHHIVHRGENARLVNPESDSVYVAAERAEVHAVASAVAHKDTAALDSLVSSGKALRLENGTPVRVTGESFNERHVQVADGPHKGRDVWVQFKWLEPR